MKILKEIKKFIRINILNKKLKEVNKEDKKCFIIMAANYGNLGDIAITYAQELFLKENLEDYQIIDVYIENVYPLYKDIKKKINKYDLITIIGGGNTGDLYIDFEEKRRFIYKKFKKNKIISFPQSIYFSNTDFGRKELEKSKKIYNDNNKLVIFARESKSYELYKKYFNVSVKLVPDIVLSLNKKFNQIRNGITICLRNDKEKDKNSENISRKILEFIEKQEYKTNFVDTHIGNVKINKEEREKVLNKFLMDFSSSKLVITDRLHGMIFCAITSTPCIVLNNNNHKILFTYNNWLKDAEYIFFANENITEIIETIKRYMNMESQFRTKDFYNEFEPLRKELKDE